MVKVIVDLGSGPYRDYWVPVYEEKYEPQIVYRVDPKMVEKTVAWEIRETKEGLYQTLNVPIKMTAREFAAKLKRKPDLVVVSQAADEIGYGELAEALQSMQKPQKVRYYEQMPVMQKVIQLMRKLGYVLANIEVVDYYDDGTIYMTAEFSTGRTVKGEDQ